MLTGWKLAATERASLLPPVCSGPAGRHIPRGALRVAHSILTWCLKQLAGKRNQLDDVSAMLERFNWSAIGYKIAYRQTLIALAFDEFRVYSSRFLYRNAKLFVSVHNRACLTHLLLISRATQPPRHSDTSAAFRSLTHKTLARLRQPSWQASPNLSKPPASRLASPAHAVCWRRVYMAAPDDDGA